MARRAAARRSSAALAAPSTRRPRACAAPADGRALRPPCPPCCAAARAARAARPLAAAVRAPAASIRVSLPRGGERRPRGCCSAGATRRAALVLGSEGAARQRQKQEWPFARVSQRGCVAARLPPCACAALAWVLSVRWNACPGLCVMRARPPRLEAQIYGRTRPGANFSPPPAGRLRPAGPGSS